MRPRSPLRALLPLAALAAFAACEGPDPQAPKPFDEVAVGESADALLDTSFDEIGPQRVAGLSGRLPGDFPESFPVIVPSSLIDFGSDGERYVLLQIPEPIDRARRRQLDRLRQAGWRVEGSELRWRADRDGRTVELTFDDLVSITDLEIRY